MDDVRSFPVVSVAFKYHAVGNSVFHGRAFQKVLLSIRLFALPKRRSSLSRIIMTIPDNNIIFSEDDLQTLVDKEKGAAEDLWRILELVAIVAGQAQLEIWLCHCLGFCVSKKVLTNCKKDWDSTESWGQFFSEWKSVVYASTTLEFRDRWNDFDEKYTLSHGDCVQYLSETYITDHSRCFVKCYTNQVLHIDTTGNLKTMVDAGNILLSNQYQNQLIELEEAKIRYPADLRKPTFQSLAGFVSPFAIRKILLQYQMLVDQHTVINRCKKVFNTTTTTTTGLPCSHKFRSGCIRKEVF